MYSQNIHHETSYRYIVAAACYLDSIITDPAILEQVQ